ncbi:MAG TPA: hypothetical protein PKN04_15525 [bacterium]|nr:hypothetical protein [bacterium]
MHNNLQQYPDFLFLMDHLKAYASPRAKLTQMIKSGEIIKVRRGLYVWPPPASWSLKTLANKIYGPSYISFEYALSYHQMIPERVEMITCASRAKNKSKTFITPVGRFFYASIPASAYPYGIVRKEAADGPFLIATPEKALCDTLSKATLPVTSLKGLSILLYEDLRIDADALAALQARDIEFLAPLYRDKTVALFMKFFLKEISHA